MAYPFQPMDRELLRELSRKIEDPHYQGRAFNVKLFQHHGFNRPPWITLPYRPVKYHRSRN